MPHPQANQQHIHLENVDGSVTVLHLDRPPVNAIDATFARELDSVFGGLEQNQDVGSVVLTGKGECFSAGLDLKAIPSLGPTEQKELVTAVNALLLRLYAFSKPLVGAVNGHAIAGGLVVALTCDYRVGADADYMLGLTEALVGIPFPVAAMEIVRAELGVAARTRVLMAQNADPAAAKAWGALDELTPPDRVLERAIEVARDQAAMPGHAYTRIKQQLRAGPIERMRTVVASGTDPSLGVWRMDEIAEAARRLVER
jgi:enoyl-CoA hydratase